MEPHLKNAAAPAPSSLANDVNGPPDRGRLQAIIEDAMNSAVSEPWEAAGHAADRILAALSPEAPAREGEAAHWLTDLLGDDQNGGFIRDLCYTVWQAGRYGYNGGPGDWVNDTLPTVQRGVEMVRAKVEGLLALTPRHEAPASEGGAS